MKETGSLFHLGEKLSNTAPPDMHLFLYFMHFKSCCCNPSTLNTNPLRFSFFSPPKARNLNFGLRSRFSRYESPHILIYRLLFFITPSAGILALSNVRILRQAVERFLIACRRLELSDVIDGKGHLLQTDHSRHSALQHLAAGNVLMICYKQAPQTKSMKRTPVD